MTSSARLRLRGGDDARAVVARLDPAHGDVVRRRQVIAHEVLEDDADVRAQRDEVVLAQVVAVEQDAALVGVVEAREQLHERRLAGAVLADQRQHFARAQRRSSGARTAQRSAPGIAEADVLEREALRGSAPETARGSAAETISGSISKNENRSSR